MPDCDGGGVDNHELVAEQIIVCTNACASGTRYGGVSVKCPDTDTSKCPKSKDFDDSSLPKEGLVKINHEKLPPGLHRIHYVPVPLGGSWGES